MSDSPWASPSGSDAGAPAPQAPVPSAPPVPPQVPPPVGIAQPAPFATPTAPPVPQPAGFAPGWTPPPKPGLIPLQPMTLGTILGASFRVLRRNPRPTFGLALLIESIIVIASAGVIGLVFASAFSRLTNATSSSAADQITNGSFGLILLAEFVPLVLSVFGMAVSQGIFSLEVARGTVGEKLTLGGLWRRAKGRMGALIGWFWAVLGMAVGGYLVFAIVLGIVIAIAAAASAGNNGTGAIVAAIVGGIVVSLGGLVLVAWLVPKLSFVPAALMLERLPLGKAMRRSWSLSRGYFWRTLGIELLVLVIVNTAVSVVTAPLEIAALAITGLFNQTGDHTTAIIITVVVAVIGGALVVALGAVSSVVQAASTALLYIDLRIRKEALDLELIRFVEARQAGDDSVQDPYLVVPVIAPPPPDYPAPPFAASPYPPPPLPPTA